MIRKTLNRTLAVAIATATLALAGSETLAQKHQMEFVNRANPFVCMTDEGYGRWSSCDRGGAD